MSQANVSKAALESLLDAFRRYQAGTVNVLPGVLRQFRERRRRLQDAEREAYREAEHCRYRLESTDDEDDIAQCQLDLEEAEERHHQIRYWVDQVESQAAWLEQHAQRFGQEGGRHLQGAQTFLQEEIEVLGTYESIGLPDVEGASATAVPVPHVIPAAAAAPRAGDGRGGRVPLADFPLPAGFRWVALSDVDVARGLEGVAGPDDYRKVDYERMRRGLVALREEILPAISADPKLGSDHFHDLDVQRGVPHEQGLQRVFDAFFGREDFIYLVKKRNRPQFDIVNGRHRLKLAQDLGWEAVPAQTKE